LLPPNSDHVMSHLGGYNCCNLYILPSDQNWVATRLIKTLAEYVYFLINNIDESKMETKCFQGAIAVPDKIFAKF